MATRLAEGTSPTGRVHDSELCETASIAAAIRQEHRILTVGIDDDGDPTGNPDAQVCGTGPVVTLREYLRDSIAGDSADYFDADDAQSVGGILDEIVSAISTTETVFHRGTLGGDLSLLQSGGLPLDGGLETPSDEIAGNPGAPERECFEPGQAQYIGFAWWLPLNIGNEIQTDAVSFDLGFYTEQCRHNDGRGLTAE